MMIEAATLPGWKQTKVKLRLLQQPSALQTLTIFRSAVETVLQSRIQTLAIAPSLIVLPPLSASKSASLATTP